MTKVIEYDLDRMTGKELFQFYADHPDYDPAYGQVLGTAFFQIGEKLFPMLEKAHRSGKKIALKQLPGYENVCDPPFDVVVE